MNKLFSEDFKNVNTNDELKRLQEQHPQYDPAYITQAACVSRQRFKVWLEELWEQYEPYADKDFPEKIKKEFLQRTWEMYLACTLLNRGFSLKQRKLRKNGGPDICLVVNERNVWIEAVAPGAGEGNDRVPEIQYGIVQKVPEEQMLLRLTSALGSKFKKHTYYINNKVVKEDEPYIIAINRSALSRPDLQIPLILKCLFSIGHLTLPITEGKPGDLFWSRRKEVKKKSGSPVSMGFFENLEYSSVSAVIYCVGHILNSPQDKNKMGDNFVFVLNPLAKNEIEENLFKFGEIRKKVDDKIIKRKY